MKRQDQLLAHMDAYAVDRETNAMLLQYLGESLSTSSKIVKSKLLAIDPTTRALLVKFGNQLPWQVWREVLKLRFTCARSFSKRKFGNGSSQMEFT